MTTVKTRLALLLCAILPIFSPLVVSAEMNKPVAAVAIRSYDGIWQGVEQIADRMGFKQNVVGFKSVLADVQGLDKSKPGGLVVLTDGRAFFPFAFLPIAKFDDLQFMGIDSLKSNIEEVDGVKTLKFDKVTLELLEKNGWLYIFEKGKSNLIPAGDPVRLLDGLNEKFIIGSKLWLEHLSPDLLDSLFSVARQQFAQKSPDTIIQWEVIKQACDQALEHAETGIFGLRTDAKGSLFIDSVSKAKPSSRLAAAYKKGVLPTSRWKGLYRPADSAFSALFCIPSTKALQEYQKENVKSTFNNMVTQLDNTLDPEDFEVAKVMLAPLREFLLTCVAQDKYDSVYTITTDPMIVFGGTLAESKNLDDFLKQAKKKIREGDEKVKKLVRFDSDKAGDYAIHTFVLSFDKSVPEWFAGRKLTVCLALRKDAVIGVIGLNEGDVSKRIKELALAPERQEKALFGQYRLSLKEIGKLLKNLDIPSSAETKQFEAIVNLLTQAPSEAAISGATESPEDGIIAEKMQIDGSIFALLGDLFRTSLGVDGKKKDAKKNSDLKDAESLFND